MADLMKKQSITTRSISKGQTIDGTVKKISSQEILIDINAKAPALVLEQDKTLMQQLLATLHVGDKVSVYVLSPEGESGYPVVSLRKHMSNASWALLDEALSKKEKITVTIGQQTKGGYVVSSEGGLSGFLPNSYTTSRDMAFGTEVKVSLVEINRDNHRFVVSQKELFSRDEFMKLSKKMRVGDKVAGTVSEVSHNGIGVSIKVSETETLPGFVRPDETAWEGFDEKAFTIGQEVSAEIIYIDTNNARIILSLKRLLKDPLADIFATFASDQMVQGTITHVEEKGYVVDLGKSPVVGYIKKETVPAGQELYEGKSVQCSVVSVAQGERRIYLVPVLLEKPMFYR